MGIFEKKPEELVPYIQKISESLSKSSESKFAELQEESKDFAELFSAYQIYTGMREKFVQNPGRDAFGSLQVFFERLQQCLKKVENHNIQDLMAWLDTQVTYEQNFIRTIQTQDVNIR